MLLLKKRKIGFIYRLKYRDILILTSMSMTILFLFIISIQFSHSISVYLKNVQDNQAKMSVNQASDLLNRQLIQLEDITNGFLEQADLPKLLTEYRTDNRAVIQAINKQLIKIHYSLQKTNENASGVLLLTDMKTFVNGDTPMLYGVTLSDFTNFYGLSRFTTPKLLPPDIQKESSGTSLKQLQNHMVLAFPVFGSNNQTIGIFCILMKSEYPQNQFENIHDITVVDQNDRPFINLTSVSNEEITDISSKYRNENIIPSGDFFIQNQNFEDIAILYIQNTTAISHQLFNIYCLVVAFDFITVLLSILIAKGISDRIIKPLNKLMEKIDGYPPAYPEDSSAPQIKFKTSLRENILYYFLVVVLPSCIVLSFFSIFLFSNITTRSVKDSLNTAFQQRCISIQTLFDNVSSVSTAIALSQSNQSALLSYNDTILDYLPDGMPYYSVAVDLSLYTKYGDSVWITNLAADSIDRFDPENAGRYSDWSTDSNTGEASFIFSMPIRIIESKDICGYLICKMPEILVSEQYVDIIKDSSNVFLFTLDGQIVSHQYKSLIGSSLDQRALILQAKNNNSLSYVYRISGTPFYFAATYDPTLLQSEQRFYFISACYLLIIILLIVFLASALLSHYFSVHFRKLSLRLSSLVADRIDNTSDESSMIFEVNRMDTAFNDMTLRIRELVNDILKASEQQHQMELNNQKAEIALLQAQINPHFIYNTFESINYMIRKGDQQQAIYMVNALSDMLRFATKENHDFISLQSELKYAQNYISIMKIRYSDVLTVSFDVNEMLYNCKVPRLILQPIIENAIIHGIIPKSVPGEISISIYSMGDKLYLIVRDNGAGIDQKELEGLITKISSKKSNQSIGIYNIHNRIRLLYGEPYGLYLNSKFGIGTTVTILLPNIQMED